jgi:acyl-[acyl carrier protein]--UDP-N-acetylglucosamine O-acyltransferase
MEALHKAYALIYNSRLNVTQAIEKIQSDPALIAVQEVQSVVTFIRNSKRGIIAGPRHGKD